MANEPNPKSYVATASGDNVMLDTITQDYVIQYLVAIPTSATPVSFYIHDGAAGTPNYLLGDPSNKITLDRTGIGGQSGFVLPFCPNGCMEAGKKIVVNLSAAVPVVFTASYMRQ